MNCFLKIPTRLNRAGILFDIFFSLHLVVFSFLLF